METDRLNLRAYERKDLPAFRELMQDPEALAFEPFGPLSEREVRKELRGRRRSPVYVAVALKDGDLLIGNLFLRPDGPDALELGFLFRRAYWGRGYAQEACRAVIEDAFAQDVSRVWAQCDSANRRSRRLLERLGFSRTDAGGAAFCLYEIRK